jgi:hypothetical protein
VTMNVTSLGLQPDASRVSIWWVGVVLKLSGSVLATLGINLQRWRHRRQAPGDERSSVSFVAHRVWWIGFVLLASDSALGFLAYAFASLGKLAPLGTITAVLNYIVAPACLGQSVRLWEKQAAVVVAIGAIVAMSCADPRTPDYSLQQLLGLLGEGSVIAFLCSINVGILGLVVLGHGLGERRRLQREEARRAARRRRAHERVISSSRTQRRDLQLRARGGGGSSPGPAGADHSPEGEDGEAESPSVPRFDGDGRHSPGSQTGCSDCDSESLSKGFGAAAADTDTTCSSESFSELTVEDALAHGRGGGRGEDEGGGYPGWMEELHSIVLPAAAGLAGGQAVLFSKITVEMAKGTVLALDDPYAHAAAYHPHLILLLPLPSHYCYCWRWMMRMQPV